MANDKIKKRGKNEKLAFNSWNGSLSEKFAHPSGVREKGRPISASSEINVGASRHMYSIESWSPSQSLPCTTIYFFKKKTPLFIKKPSQCHTCATSNRHWKSCQWQHSLHPEKNGSISLNLCLMTHLCCNRVRARWEELRDASNRVTRVCNPHCCTQSSTFWKKLFRGLREGWNLQHRWLRSQKYGQLWGMQSWNPGTLVVDKRHSQLSSSFFFAHATVKLATPTSKNREKLCHTHENEVLNREIIIFSSEFPHF